jgi:hypothetical protein
MGCALQDAIRPYSMRCFNHDHETMDETKNGLEQAGDCGRYCWFAFVRNPWDWTVSYYYHRREEAFIHPDATDQDRALWTVNAELGFVEWVRGGMSEIRGMTQSEFIGHDLDFVGRFEHLHRDYQTVCDRLEIENYLSRYHERRTGHKPYRDEYAGDDAAIKMVGERFAEDVERFGYCF